jgi:hypothetical protein
MSSYVGQSSWARCVALRAVLGVVIAENSIRRTRGQGIRRAVATWTERERWLAVWHRPWLRALRSESSPQELEPAPSGRACGSAALRQPRARHRWQPDRPPIGVPARMGLANPAKANYSVFCGTGSQQAGSPPSGVFAFAALGGLPPHNHRGLPVPPHWRPGTGYSDRLPTRRSAAKNGTCQTWRPVLEL